VVYFLDDSALCHCWRSIRLQNVLSVDTYELQSAVL
ncbi:unnamed protein product, partial [Allacma fusca]